LFDESHGLFGSLATAAPGSDEGNAEAQMVTAALDVVLLDVQALLKDIANGASRATIKQDLKTLQADLTQFEKAEKQFLKDERHASSSKHDTARALKHDLDDLDDLFAQLARKLR